MNIRNPQTTAFSALKTIFAGLRTQIGLTFINAPSKLLNRHRLHKDLPYGSEDGQRLDLYLPDEVNNSNGQLVVFVYGGSWNSGKKEDYAFVADAFSSAGYAVAIPDYAKYPQVQFPRFVEDIATAIAWLAGKQQQLIAVNAVSLIGHSAGAHSAALLSTDPSYLAAQGLNAHLIKCFVGMAGPYTWTPDSRNYRNIFANLADFSTMRPDNFVSGSEPPMLLLHGNDDSTVLPKHTRKFADTVNARGGNAAYNIFANTGHVKLLVDLSRVARWNSKTLKTILNFLASDTH